MISRSKQIFNHVIVVLNECRQDLDFFANVGPLTTHHVGNVINRAERSAAF